MKIRTQFIPALAALTFAMGSAHGATITIDAAASNYITRATFIGASYNAGGSDKLVVIVTGEHNFGGTNTGGNVSGLTYNGTAMTQAVQRQPTAANILVAGIWYLDNPGNQAASFAVTAGGNGNNYVFTVLRLSGTLDGVGATAISALDSKTVNLTTTAADSLVLAMHGLGGDGNTAATSAITVDSPGTKVTNVSHSSNWVGQVVSSTEVASAGTATYGFTGGATGGNLTIAAEFLAVPEPSSALLGGLGLLALLRRRR
jgi:hypothetical protein